MVLMRFFRFRLLAIVLLCILKVSFVCAKDFSELNQTPYLQTLTDDSLQYAWRLYIIRKSNFSPNPKRSVRKSHFHIKRSVLKTVSAQHQKCNQKRLHF